MNGVCFFLGYHRNFEINLGVVRIQNVSWPNRCHLGQEKAFLCSPDLYRHCLLSQEHVQRMCSSIIAVSSGLHQRKVRRLPGIHILLSRTPYSHDHFILVKHITFASFSSSPDISNFYKKSNKAWLFSPDILFYLLL